MAKITRTSLLITQKGAIDAYRVKVGDFALCADGRFRKVEKVEKTKGKVWELKGHGHPKLWVPVDQQVWSTHYSRGEEGRHFKPFTFSNPGEMKGLFWGSPCLYPVMKADINLDEAWLAGLTMAAGRADKNQPILVLIHESKREELENRLHAMKIKFFQSSLHTQYQYQVNAQDLSKWILKNMEQTLGRKMVPLQVLCGAKELQRSFYDGYIFGKGTIEEEKYRMSTDNKVEAITIKLLSQALTLSTALYLTETKVEKEVREYWQIVAEKSARSSAVIGRNRWGLVREGKLTKGEKPQVIVEVEGGHSLIVDGIVFK